jgi:hypothetical protein
MEDISKMEAKMKQLQIVSLVLVVLAGNGKAEKWQMNQKDIWHTGRAVK